MNQNGWGLKDFLFILGIITLALLITAGIYKRSFKNLFGSEPKPIEEETKVIETETYKDLEYKLKRAAERYQNDNYQGNFESTETWILNYKLLRKDKYLKEKLNDIYDRSIECNGYVRFEKRQSNIDYHPFLKCGNSYKTEGYDEKYEES